MTKSDNDLGVLSLKVSRILVAEKKKPHWTYVVAKRLGVNRGSIHAILGEFTRNGWLVKYRAPGDTLKSERVMYALTDPGFVALKGALDPYQIMPVST